MQLLTDMGIIHNTYVRMYIGNNKYMLCTYMYWNLRERENHYLYMLSFTLLQVKLYIIARKTLRTLVVMSEK